MLQSFVVNVEGTPVRVFALDGHIRLVHSDCCKALEIGHPSKALLRIDDSHITRIRRSDTLTFIQGIWEHFAPQVQEITLIDEAGFNDLVLRSDKPNARAIREKVISEIMPQIMRTGRYTPSAAPAIVAPPSSHMQDWRELPLATRLSYDLVDAAKQIDAHERTISLQSDEIARLDERLDEVEPLAEIAQKFLNREGTYSVREAATLLVSSGVTTGERRLWRFLQTRSWIYRNGRGDPAAYQPYLEHDLLFHLPQSHQHPHTGEEIEDSPQVRVTKPGLIRLRELLLEGSEDRRMLRPAQ